MRLPIHITVHHSLLVAMMKVMGILAVGYIAITIITLVIELRLDLLFNLRFWLASWAQNGFICIFIALPICFSPFIRPLENTWQRRLVQGIVIMALASPVFVWFMTETLSLPLSSHGPEGAFRTSMALLVPFYIINAAIYLPGIFGWGQN